jgi:ribulose-phosphate 3-epimerase
MINLAPSILAADFLQLGEQVRQMERAGADRLHLDVMDGVFVPNISFGLPVVQSLRRATKLALETHLMIVEPERWVDAFVRAGSDTIIVHQEVSPHLDRTLHAIQEHGRRAGVAINPATPVDTLAHVLDFVDLVLVMTVNPGFGGQAFIRPTLEKIRQVRRLLDKSNPKCDLEVDGGIDEKTAPLVVKAGARALVAGTSVFGHKKGAAAGARAVLKAARES